MENPTNVVDKQPHIILITVDQLRYPMHFASLKNRLGIDTVDQFVEKFMPNLFKYLWQPGVKFSNYYTAASDCTAARATIHTGLYAYQTYSMLTLISYPPDKPTQPELHKDFPTIGHLMRHAGYQTPYFGKWHLSYDVADLEKYGYTSNTPNQDYVGYAGEGQGTDDAPAYQAAHWINDYVRSAKSKEESTPGYKPEPFFLTLNFVNPHDKQWFWGAMEADDFYQVYGAVKKAHPSETPPGPYIEIFPQDEPPPVYHEEIDLAIPNWQSQDELDRKPKAQTVVKEVFQYQMGGIYEVDQKQKQQYTPVDSLPGFFYADAPAHSPGHKAIAPHTYWSRALDSYLQVMRMVDHSIGNFMKSIREEVRENAIFIFTSDHGEYGSSHGLQGKGGTVYDEGIRVPLIVLDARSNGYAKNPEVERKQLTSSVDLLPMIVSMGNGGTRAWMTGNEYEKLYGNRWDLLKILGNPAEPGRTYALHSTDEFIPGVYNFNGAPLHVIGLIQTNPDGSNKTKLGVYTNWLDHSTSPNQATVINPLALVPPPPRSIEFYDQNQYLGSIQEPLEKESIPENPQAAKADSLLFDKLLGSELQAPLPTKTLQDAQTLAYTQLVGYMQLVNAMTQPTQTNAPPPEEVERRLARVWAF
jgi:uncharacterized sulfatase